MSIEVDRPDLAGALPRTTGDQEGAVMLTEQQRQVVAEFPELKKLLALHEQGWQFRYIVQVLVGMREWPGGWLDHFYLVNNTDCWAARTTYDDDLVWERTGSLDDVVDALHELPAPDQPHAPKLVRGERPPPLRLITTPGAVRQ